MREFNAKLGKLEFSFEWRLTLLVIVLVPVMISLGYWQLDRAEEKRGLSERHTERTALPPISLAEALTAYRESGLDELADRQIAFRGQLVAKDYLLVDNRIKNGRFGYELIALIAADNVRVPVNLGWIEGDSSRQTLPVPNLSPNERMWHGRIYIPLGDPYLLAEQTPPTQLPAVIQSYQPKKYGASLADTLNSTVPPFTVRLASDHPLALVTDWPIVNQSPEKHTGYAVQWFTMAAVLWIAFVLRSSNITKIVFHRSNQKTP